ncbi:hypothetical protein F-VV57_0210 [Faustovirus]|nr:hypothetical protein F-VV57_0210 [Faustovirus]QJX73477.1 metallopeptidase [Faustovirus]
MSNLCEYYNTVESMYFLRTMKATLLSCRYGNITSSMSYQLLNAKIDKWIGVVDAHIIDVVNGKHMPVKTITGIYIEVIGTANSVNFADIYVTEARRAAEALLRDDAITLYAKVNNYITTLEYYYRDLMDRTLIPEYADRVVHHTYTLESYIADLYAINRALLNGSYHYAMNDTVRNYIRSAQAIVRGLPTDVTLAASIAIIRRAIEVYNSENQHLATMPTIASCCSTQRYRHDEHREQLKAAVAKLVTTQKPFTVDQATRHIRRFMSSRSGYHHCTKYH